MPKIKRDVIGKLLNCPFCGEPVTMQNTSIRKCFVIKHKIFNRFCIIGEITFKEESLASATDAWNRRAKMEESDKQ